MDKKVNISAIKSKINFIYKDEREKNIAAIVIYNKDGKFFFDPEYKNEMSNLEVEALLLRGALVDRGGKYYRPSSFNDNNVSFSDAVINPEDIEVDLSGYVTKDELNAKADINDIPTKLSDLQNDSNFLTSIPSEYVTDTELNNKGYVTKDEMEDAMDDIDLSDYITDAELTSKNYATKDYVDKKAFNGGSNATVVDNVEPAENDMPRLFLYDGVLPTTKDSVVMAFEYISKNKRFQGYVDIKCQGTSSMDYNKKNFTIKLFSDEALENKIKINFMNWGEQNKFCLKANWVDSTHTRNIVGARIGYDIVQSRPDSEFKRNLLTAPRCGLIDGFPIKLYYKGEFYGIYTWNIPKDAWQFAMDENNENHIVLCAEKNSDGKTSVINSCQFKALWTNGDEGDWSVEVGTYSNSLVAKWNRVISFVKDSTDEEFINNFEQYFDLYSVIDYYCFSYFMVHLDGLAKNMLVATYDGNIWGCSLYDMDTTAGAYWNSTRYVPYNHRCPEDYQEPFSLLWERIEKCFTQILCERYFALRGKELSLANIINHIERLYDIIPDRVFNDEKEKWTNIPQVTTNTMTRVRNYLRDRAQYVDKQFNKLMNGEDEPDTPQNDAIYTLGETQVLDGTSKYIDTGIALLEENIDYTIFVEFSMNAWAKQSSLLHCMNEVEPYPGINLQTVLDGFILSGANLSEEIGKTSTNEYLIPKDTDVQHSVFVRREGDTITMITEVGRFSCEYTHNSVNKNLLIGAYQTSDGVVGRWLNCTVYQAKVWNRALSDDEMSSYVDWI